MRKCSRCLSDFDKTEHCGLLYYSYSHCTPTLLVAAQCGPNVSEVSVDFGGLARSFDSSVMKTSVLWQDKPTCKKRDTSNRVESCGTGRLKLPGMFAYRRGIRPGEPYRAPIILCHFRTMAVAHLRVEIPQKAVPFCTKTWKYLERQVLRN